MMMVMMMVMVVRSKVQADGEADGDGQEPVGFTDRCSYHRMMRARGAVR